MSSTYPTSVEGSMAQGGHDHDHDVPDRHGDDDQRDGHGDGPCAECDLSELDDLTCRTAGVRRQADYMGEHADDLERRRSQFDSARMAYAQARQAVQADVKQVRHDLHRVREQVRCQLDDDVVHCLDRAWEDVWARLRRCRGETGCCVDDDDCDFDTHCHHRSTSELVARITDYEKRVAAAERCFDDLVTEPASLEVRVAELRAAVEELLGAVSDPTTADPERGYATLRWLWQRLDDVWRGFDDASQFHDCLCTALTCSIRGRRALGELEAELAVRRCRDDAEDARCQWLREHVVEELLAACDRICGPGPERRGRSSRAD